MSDKKFIENSLKHIKDQTGLSLCLCNYFTGLRNHNGRRYFNVVLKDKVCESLEYEILERFSRKYKTIEVEQSGLKRVAIFI